MNILQSTSSQPFLVIVIALFLFSLGIISLSVTSADSNFVTVDHDPDENITSDDDVTIYVQLNSTANITSVEFLYCEIEPVGVCSIYAEMTHNGGTNYSAVIGKGKGGTTMGYKIKIEYDDGREDEYSPGKDSYNEYFIEKDPEDDDDDSPFLPIPFVLGSVLLAAVFIRKRS